MLEVRGLKVSYGGINAVKGVDLDVAEGELVTLIGANGAGKTTTLKALAGLLRPAAGRIHYNGIDITARPAFELVRQGLALVPEGRGVFGRLTVEENLAMGAYSRRDRARITTDFDRVYGLLPRLAERRRQPGGKSLRLAALDPHHRDALGLGELGEPAGDGDELHHGHRARRAGRRRGAPPRR